VVHLVNHSYKVSLYYTILLGLIKDRITMEMYGIGNKTVIVYQIRPDNVVEYVHSVTLNPNWVAWFIFTEKVKRQNGTMPI